MAISGGSFLYLMAAGILLSCIVFPLNHAAAQPSSTSPTITTSGISTTSPPSTTSGISATSPPSTTSGISATSPPSTTSGISATSPPSTTSGISATSPPTTTSGISATSPPTQTSGISATSPPSTTSGISATSPPSTTSGISATTPPSTTSGISATSPPSTASGISATSPPSAASGISATSPPSTTSGISATSPPSTTSGISATSPPNTTSGISATSPAPSRTATLLTPSSSRTSATATKSSPAPDTAAVSPTSAYPAADTTAVSPEGPHIYAVENLNVSLPFSLKVKRTFNRKLLDKTSDEFKNLSEEYTKELASVFNTAGGYFRSVLIKRFWNGSIGMDYDALLAFKKANDTSTLNKTLIDTVLPALRNLSDVDKEYLEYVFINEVEQGMRTLENGRSNPCRLDGACTAFHACDLLNEGLFSCTSPCDLQHFDCGNGNCSLNSEGNPECRCPHDEHYVYGGDRCEQRAEKLKFSFDTTIAIVGGLGGGLILIMAIALGFTCYKWRQRRQKGSDLDRKSEASFQSMSETKGVTQNGTALDAYRLHRQTEHSDRPAYLRVDSGLPGDDQHNRIDVRPDPFVGQRETTMGRQGEELRYGADGRIYHVLKDSKIYQDSHQPPFQFRNQAFDSSSDEPDILRDRRRSQNRQSHQSEPTSRVTDAHPRYVSMPKQEPISRAQGSVPLGGRPDSPKYLRDSAYSRPEEETMIYQPEKKQQPQPRLPAASTHRDVYDVDPNELSGFPRQGQQSGSRSSFLYEGRSRRSTLTDEGSRSSYHEDMRQEKVRRLSDTRHPAWTDSPNNRVNKNPQGGQRREGRSEPAVFDFSERAPPSQHYQDNRSGRNPVPQRGHVYDYILDEKISLQRPSVSARPKFF